MTAIPLEVSSWHGHKFVADGDDLSSATCAHCGHRLVIDETMAEEEAKAEGTLLTLIGPATRKALEDVRNEDFRRAFPRCCGPATLV